LICIDTLRKMSDKRKDTEDENKALVVKKQRTEDQQVAIAQTTESGKQIILPPVSTSIMQTSNHHTITEILLQHID
jgi:hypothetical protein